MWKFCRGIRPTSILGREHGSDREGTNQMNLTSENHQKRVNGPAEDSLREATAKEEAEKREQDGARFWLEGAPDRLPKQRSKSSDGKRVHKKNRKGWNYTADPARPLSVAVDFGHRFSEPSGSDRAVGRPRRRMRRTRRPICPAPLSGPPAAAGLMLQALTWHWRDPMPRATAVAGASQRTSRTGPNERL